MSYLSQISLIEAKEWLRLDDNSNDNIVTILIESACSFFEAKTNHFIFQRTKEYKKDERIYDYPIADTTGLTEKSNYFIAESDISLSVGYPSGELPSEIKELILTMIEVKFYANEDEMITNYPSLVNESLQRFKRFCI